MLRLLSPQQGRVHALMRAKGLSLDLLVYRSLILGIVRSYLGFDLLQFLDLIVYIVAGLLISDKCH